MVKIALIGEVKRKPNLREITDNEGNKYILSADFLSMYNISLYSEYSLEEWQDIVIKSDTDRGINYAMDYLSRGQRTEREIADKLKEKKFHYKAVSNILSRLKELDYINDEKYAKDYVAYYGGSRGKIRLKSELFLKGVDRRYIDEAVAELKDEDESCLEIARRRLDGKIPEGKEKEKLIRFLLARGYTYGIIRETLKRLGGNADDISDL
jgi:regulatory protein